MARAVNDIVSRDIAWKHMIPFHRKNIWENMYQCSCVTIDFMFRQPRPQYEKCYIAMLRTVYIHVHGKPYPNRTFPVFFLGALTYRSHSNSAFARNDRSTGLPVVPANCSNALAREGVTRCCKVGTSGSEWSKPQWQRKWSRILQYPT